MEEVQQQHSDLSGHESTERWTQLHRCGAPLSLWRRWALSRRGSSQLDADLASAAVEEIVDATGGNINQLENVSPSLTQLFVCFGQLACRKCSSSCFPERNRASFGASFCPPPLSPSQTDKHTYLFVHKWSKFQTLCVSQMTDVVCCPTAAVGKSQMWGNWFLLHDWACCRPGGLTPGPCWIVWEIALHSLMETRLGERGALPFTPAPAPEGSSQACAINFLTIYSQVEFIFPEEPHMWRISGFRLWGWGGRGRLGSQSIKVVTNSVFLEERPL